MSKKDRSPRVEQREKIKETLQIKEFEWTEKQKQLINLINDKNTQLVFIDGPSGSSKTLISVYCALLGLNQKKFTEIIYVRSLAESATKSIGSLPGEIEQKFEPFILPLEDKLEELLTKSDKDKLLQDSRIKPIPINFLRGTSFAVKFLLLDEAQNFTFKELVTAITRVGRFSKLIVLGDRRQADINGKSGFKKMFDIFNDEESRSQGIFCFEFTKDDIMRSGLVKFIVEKLENYELNQDKKN